MNGYKTAEAAAKAWEKNYGGMGYVYQFPAGHWNYCSPNSPVGRRLVECQEIYEGVPATSMATVNFPETTHGRWTSGMKNYYLAS